MDRSDDAIAALDRARLLDRTHYALESDAPDLCSERKAEEHEADAGPRSVPFVLCELESEQEQAKRRSDDRADSDDLDPYGQCIAPRTDPAFSTAPGEQRRTGEDEKQCRGEEAAQVSSRVSPFRSSAMPRPDQE
ncbi:MAG: hypothetical protein AAFP86_05670 [Planctomycetota bacterium]